MATTIHEVARAAGVSTATVSRALNGAGRVSAATRARVLTTAQDLGYQPNDVARSLLGKSTQTIAIVVPDITNPFFPELVKGFEAAADAREHLVLLCDSAEDEMRVWKDLAALRRKQVDGVVLVGVRLGEDRLAAVTSGLPVVTVDREVRLRGASVVQSDHRAGGLLATQHLVELGHRRIAHLSGPPGVSVSELRRKGYLDALRSAGHKRDDALNVTAGFLERDGYDATRELVSRGVHHTAVFAANDLVAIGALDAYEELGIHVPDDVSVVGFDDIHLSRYIRPRLTTVRQDIFGLGARAAEILIDQLSHGAASPPKNEIIPVELVARDSASAAPSAEPGATQRRKGRRG